MSVITNNLLLTAAASVSQYQISRSLRFNSADSAYLNRAPSVSGNLKTWTFSFWIKRVNLSASVTYVLGSFPNAATELIVGFTSSNQFYIEDYQNAVILNVTSAAVFRDTSAWYHLLASVDTTQATASDRVKIYANGTQITSLATATYPSQNVNTVISGSGTVLAISARGRTFANPASQYLADVHFIDGQALTPSSFTETDANGELQPKLYSGSYGTNGFKLNFSDNSAATAATLGADSSGNGNNWTPNNLSVTAGTGNDSLTDTPTSYGTDTGAGGEVRGNYATLNPLSTLTTVTLANGNLDYSSTTASRTTIATIGVSSGKWYWEVSTTAGTTQTQVGVYGTSASTLFSLAANSTVYGIRFDADTGALDRTSDGVTFTSIATGLTSGPYFPYFNNNGTTAKVVSVNFGQRPFAYAASSGFKALCDTNLPTPTIAKGSSAFDTVLYTGTGAARSITGLLFSPDFVWIKTRSAASTDHRLTDTVRGATKRFASNTVGVEATDANGLTAFNSDGFSLGTDTTYNNNAATFAGWCWDAGSSTVTNTTGTSSSQVRANASAGFSVITYTGNGSAGATVGHGLGVAPRLIIPKARVLNSNWWIYHAFIGATRHIILQTSAAQVSSSTAWNSTAPSATVITLGANAEVNGAGSFGAYCFAPVTGYSAFDGYTGNGSADGPFIYTGFKPAFLIIKRTNGAGNWVMLDNKREGYNVDNDPLYANLANAEGTDDLIDITSNGFKIRSTSADVNTSTSTYLYAAFAENPFQYARAR